MLSEMRIEITDEDFPGFLDQIISLKPGARYKHLLGIAIGNMNKKKSYNDLLDISKFGFYCKNLEQYIDLEKECSPNDHSVKNKHAIIKLVNVEKVPKIQRKQNETPSDNLISQNKKDHPEKANAEKVDPEVVDPEKDTPQEDVTMYEARQWLIDIGFENYIEKIFELGFDELDVFKEMTGDDVEEIINDLDMQEDDKPKFRDQIKMLKETVSMSAVRRWLTDIGFEEHVDTFFKLGYDDLNYIKEMKSYDIETMIKDLGLRGGEKPRIRHRIKSLELVDYVTDWTNDIATKNTGRKTAEGPDFSFTEKGKEYN